MSTEIFYFSGTGNSLHVARELQARLPGAELIPIISLVNQESVTSEAETVGFVFPHYASTLPKIVRTFVQRLDLASASYLFAVVTRGRTGTRAFDDLDSILEEKGRALDSFFVFTMPSGSEPLVKDYHDKITEERIDWLQAAMLSRLDAIQTTILERRTDRTEDTGPAEPPPAWLVPLVPLLEFLTPVLLPLGKLVESSFEFYVDEKCTSCRICERVCLANRVEMLDGQPVWLEDVPCHGCFACLNYCPEESVQVKSSWYLPSHTASNGRYHHPQITAGDIARQKQAA